MLDARLWLAATCSTFMRTSTGFRLTYTVIYDPIYDGRFYINVDTLRE